MTLSLHIYLQIYESQHFLCFIFRFSRRLLQRCVMTLKPNPQQMFVFQQMWKTSLFNLNGFLNKFRHTLTTLHLPRRRATAHKMPLSVKLLTSSTNTFICKIEASIRLHKSRGMQTAACLQSSQCYALGILFESAISQSKTRFIGELCRHPPMNDACMYQRGAHPSPGSPHTAR